MYPEKTKGKTNLRINKLGKYAYHISCRSDSTTSYKEVQDLYKNQFRNADLIENRKALLPQNWRKEVFDYKVKDATLSILLGSSPQKNKSRKSKQITNRILPYLLKQAEIENVFMRLADQWRRETRGVSSTNEMAMHPAYQQIIGMGKVVVPLLLRELERKSGQWFWALKAITREDPVPPEFKGRTKEMIRIWLDWGRVKGYTW